MKLDGESKIELKLDANPYSLSILRRILLPLMPNVKQELKCMEDLGVISKVEPTNWCSGIVPESKPNSEVHRCVDLLKLNH